MLPVTTGLSLTLNAESDGLYSSALTDRGNAQRFAELFAETVRYVPTRGWFLFVETHWRPVNTDTMLSLAHQSLDTFQERTSQLVEEDSKLSERILKHLTRCESLSRLQALLRLARTFPAMQLSYAELDADPYLLNLRNGTLDLRSGELLPHNYQHYLTRLLPYDYTSESSAPIWETFLDRLTGSDAELKLYLQRAVGATLFGASNESIAFVLTGQGRRAHQVFLTVLRQLLGSYATHNLALKERTLTPTVLTSRLLTTSYSALMRACDPAILSAFLNHEPLTITKASTELLFQPHATLWLSAPELSQLPVELAFLSEYIQPIPLSLSLSSYEAAQLSAQLQLALPTILHWAIEGFQLWYTEAPNEPACIQQATLAFQEAQEPVALFLAQACLTDPEATIPADTLYQSYLTWAHTSKERPLSASCFDLRVLTSGLQRTHRDSGYCYQGLRLRTPIASTSQLEEDDP